MKHLKGYKLFLEDGFEIKDSDKEDVKMSKEKMNDINKDIADYNAKKSQISTIYKNAKTIEETNDKIKAIIGDVEKGNPFLIEFNNISRIEKEINLLHDENTADKIRIDDLKADLPLITDKTVKLATNSKISDINSRISGRNKKILDKTKQFQDLQKEHIKKMSDMKINMTEYIKKISDSE